MKDKSSKVGFTVTIMKASTGWMCKDEFFPREKTSCHIIVSGEGGKNELWVVLHPKNPKLVNVKLTLKNNPDKAVYVAKFGLHYFHCICIGIRKDVERVKAKLEKLFSAE